MQLYLILPRVEPEPRSRHCPTPTPWPITHTSFIARFAPCPRTFADLLTRFLTYSLIRWSADSDRLHGDQDWDRIQR